MTRRTVAALACAVLLAAAACGDGTASEAERVTKATADKLSTIRSGELQFRLVAGAGAQEPVEGAEVGFELKGPFALAKPGGLPVAQIDYTRLAGGTSTTTQVISTGSQAFVVVDGNAYQLPFSQVERLRAPQAASDDGGLGGLRIDEWIKDPELSPGEPAGDVATDRITGEVDVVKALNDLFAFGREVGASDLAVPEIKGDDADQLRRVTESATVELVTGKEDRLLRRLALDIRLTAQVPERVKKALGPVAGAHIRFSMAVDNPNTPVEVTAPTGARPASALPRPS